MMKHTITHERPRILDRVEEEGFVTFDGQFDLNLIGLRSPAVEANKFDDHFFVICKVDGFWNQWIFECTTDSGLYYLLNPSRISGTAIMMDPQQARSVYKLDLHGGKYEALCQRNGSVKVWRDSNKDEVLDRSGDIETGWFGINIHRASSHREVEEVGRYSAGCTVIQDPRDFEKLIELCHKQVETLGVDTFTYTLIAGVIEELI